jgi:glutamate--cysteine ligase
MAGKLPALPGETPMMNDWVDHVSTLFPEVRLKRFLEMRGADGGPWRSICALPAFWVGLLYDGASLDAAWDLVKDWTLEEHIHLRAEVPRQALQTPFRDRPFIDLAREVLEIAESGLKSRNIVDFSGADETKFLVSLWETVDNGLCPAREKLEDFHGRWGGSVDPVFTEAAY